MSIVMLPVAIKSSASENNWMSVVINSESTMAVSSTTNHINNIEHPQHPVPSMTKHHQRRHSLCHLQDNSSFRNLFDLTNILAYILVPIALLFSATGSYLRMVGYWYALSSDIMFFAYVSVQCKQSRSLMKWLFMCLLVLPFWLVYDCLPRESAVKVHRSDIDIGLFLCRCWSLPLRICWSIHPIKWLTRTSNRNMVLILITLLGLIALIIHGNLHIFRCLWLLSFDKTIPLDYYESLSLGVAFLFNNASTIPSTTWMIIATSILLMTSALFTLYWQCVVFSYFYNVYKRVVALQYFTDSLVNHLRTSSNVSDKALSQKVIRNHKNQIGTEGGGDTNALLECDALMHLCNGSLLQDVLFDVRLPALRSAFMFMLKHDASDSYIRHISTLMQVESFNSGEHIFERGHLIDRMYILISGHLEVLTDDDDTVMLTLDVGTCIAQMALFFRLRARATVRCRTNVRLIVLTKSDFLTGTLESFVSIYRLMRRNCMQHVADGRIRHRTILAQVPRSTIGQQYHVVDREDTMTDGEIFLHKTWNALITTAAVLVTLTYPYLIAFHRGFPLWFQWFSVPIEALFVIDWLLGVLHPIGKLRTHMWRKQSKLRKCKRFRKHVVQVTQNWCFYIDFCACVYLEHLVYAFEENSDHTNFLFYFCKLNRVIKVYKFFYSLEQLRGCHTSWKRTLLNSLYFSLVTYFSAIVYYLAACFHIPCAKNSWFHLLAVTDLLSNSSVPLTKDRFLVSLHMSLATLLRLDVAFNDLVNMLENIIFALLVIVGCLLIIWFVMETTTWNYLRMKQKLVRKSDWSDINILATHYNFPGRLHRRMTAFYKIRMNNNYSYMYNQTPAITFLSRPLASELLFQQRLDHLMRVPFIAHIGIHFAELLALKSKLYLLPANDIVTNMGNMNKEMFVLKQGYCAYKTKDSYYKKIGPIGEYSPFSHFGMVSLIFNLPEVYTVRTLTTCILISIDGSALQEALLYYPHVNVIIRDIFQSSLYLNLVEESKHIRYSHLELSMDDGDNYQKPGNCKTFTETNFINVLYYCRKRNEEYRQPFKRCGISPLMYIILPLVIIPWGIFYRSWQVLRILVSYAYAVLSPLAFLLPLHETNMFMMNIFCDLVVYADFLIESYLSYVNPRGILVVHPVHTLRNFKEKGLFVNIVMAIPFAWLAPSQYFRALRCICILQVIKFFAFLSHLDNYKSRHFAMAATIIKCISWTILIANCFACFLVAIDCWPSEVSGVNVLMCNPQGWIARSQYWSQHDIKNDTIVQVPTFDAYLLGFYWSICLMFGLNWHDVFVQGGATLIACIVLLCLSIFLYGYCMTLLLPLWLTSETSVKKFRMLDYRFKLLQLRKFMDRYNTSKELKTKINRNALFFWKRSNGIDRTLVLSHLHTTLLQDSLSFLYEDTLRQVPLFQGLDKAFLRIVSLIAKPLYFLPDQVLINSEDVSDEFYIIHEGIIHVELARSSYHINLSRGSLLGYFSKEITPLMSITAKTTTYVDVLCFKSIDYFNILKNYTKLDNEVKNVLSEYKDFIPSRKGEDSLVNVVMTEKKKPANCARNVIMQNVKFHNYSDVFISLLAFLNLIIISFNFIAPNAIIIYCNCILDLSFMLYFSLNFVRPFYNDRCELITNYTLIRKNLEQKRKLYVAEFALMVLVLLSYAFLIGNKPIIIQSIGEPFDIFAKVRLLALYRCKYLTKRNFIEPDDTLLHFEAISRILFGITIGLHAFACLWCVVTIYSKPSKFATVEDKLDVYLKSFLLAANILHSTATLNMLFESRIEFIAIITSIIALRIFMSYMLYSIIYYFWMCLKVKLRFILLLTEITTFLKNLPISKFQIRALTDHLIKMEKLEFGCNFPVILSQLPGPVVCELKIAYYKPLLEKSYIFHGTQSNFLRNIAVHLQRAVYFDGEIIVHVGEISKCMFFIFHGIVEIISVNDNHTETKHDELHENEMFGLGQGLFKTNAPHQFTFKAKQRVEILSLHVEHWEHLLRFFPKSKDIIYQRIRAVQL